VPKGLYYLSLYEVIKTLMTMAAPAAMPIRDYRISIRPHQASELGDIRHFKANRMGARSVLSDFWARCLESFPRAAVRRSWTFRSPEAILSMRITGVMLDLVDELPPRTLRQSINGTLSRTRTNTYDRLPQVRIPPNLLPAATEAEAASRLFQALQKAQIVNSTWWALNRRRFYTPLLRWYTEQEKWAKKPSKASKPAWPHAPMNVTSIRPGKPSSG